MQVVHAVQRIEPEHLLAEACACAASRTAWTSSATRAT
jgi:hypothetical protein